MKTLTPAVLAAVLTLAPAAAFAQAAAGSVPNAFDRPAEGQAAPSASAPTRPAPSQALPPIGSQTPPQAEAQAQPSDIARSEEALRAVIADAQGTGFDYSDFTDNLAEQIRPHAEQVTTLIKGFGDIRSIEFERPEGGAHLFKVTFDNQATEWLIGFTEDDKIAALLFRPAED